MAEYIVINDMYDTKPHIIHNLTLLMHFLILKRFLYIHRMYNVIFLILINLVIVVVSFGLIFWHLSL